MADRRAELAANLQLLRRRVGHACREAGRSPEGVTVVAITKTRPASDVQILADLGVRHIGENRDQEARVKAAACAGLPLTWHFVGQLQRNKAASVARYADVVQSVDREPLVAALDRGAARAGRQVGVCLQVDLDPRAGSDRDGRGGAAPEAVPGLAAAVADAANLELLGVMAVAPLGAEPLAAFQYLASIHDGVRRRHPSATMMSAGMSADFEAGISAGATHIRIGSALLGARTALK